MSSEIIRTSRPSTFLRTVGDTEDTMWLYENRKFTHPAPPNKPAAPEYAAYQKLRAARENQDENILDYGIWDTKTFPRVILPGLVTVTTLPERRAELGCRIAPRFQGRDYASLALESVIGRLAETGKCDTIVAEVLTGNIASHGLVAKLGMEAVQTGNGRVYYELSLNFNT